MARAKRARAKRNPRMSAKRVNQLGGEYNRAVMQWGAHDMATSRALGRYLDARNQWERENGRPFGTARANPAVLTIGANPPGKTRGSRSIGRQVEAVYYVHTEDGKRYVHEFERNGVRMEGLEDGSIRIYHPKLRVWEDF